MDVDEVVEEEEEVEAGDEVVEVDIDRESHWRERERDGSNLM